MIRFLKNIKHSHKIKGLTLLFLLFLMPYQMYADPGFGTDDDPGDPQAPIDDYVGWMVLVAVLLYRYIIYQQRKQNA